MPLFGRRRSIPPIPLPYDSTHGNTELRVALDTVNTHGWAPARDLMAAAGVDHAVRSSYALKLAEALADGPVSGISEVDGERRIDTEGTWADRWVAEEPGNVDAHLVRLRSLISRAWKVRGGDRAHAVGRAAFDEFHRVLRLLLPACEAAAHVDPTDPGVWSPMITATKALGAPRATMERFREMVVERDPHHREGHYATLSYLCEKWQGSHAEMYEFARGAAATAPAGSALQMLPIEAHIEYLLYALDFTSSREERNAMLLPWLKDEQTRLDIDNALAHWFPQADSKHPHWYDDLNGLAYVCFWAQRLPDAKPVFEAIGDHATMRPWYWAGDPRAKFLDSRATALSS